MKSFITGANGFIGKQLLQDAVSEFDEIRVLSRKKLQFKEFSNVVSIQGDLTSPTIDLRESLKDCDVIFHCAGEIKNPSLMKALHVDGTAKLLTAAKEEAHRRNRTIHFVHLSSVGVYGPPIIANEHRIITEETAFNPKGEYELTKAQSDLLVLEAAEEGIMTYSILRPSNVIGQGMNNQSLRKLTLLMKKNLFIPIGNLDGIATYVHVKDVSLALIKCGKDIGAINEIYNLSHDCSMKTMLSALSRSCGKELSSLRVPEKLIRGICKFSNKFIRTPFTNERIDALVIKTEYPTTKIQNQLYFKCQHDIPTVISEVIK
jgi:nucleoside-diphosphate-sugar epimerase